MSRSRTVTTPPPRGAPQCGCPSVVGSTACTGGHLPHCCCVGTGPARRDSDAPTHRGARPPSGRCPRRRPAPLAGAPSLVSRDMPVSGCAYEDRTRPYRRLPTRHGSPNGMRTSRRECHIAFQIPQSHRVESQALPGVVDQPPPAGFTARPRWRTARIPAARSGWRLSCAIAKGVGNHDRLASRSAHPLHRTLVVAAGRGHEPRPLPDLLERKIRSDDSEDLL